MSKEISTRISPEGLEIANAYLQLGSVQLVSSHLNIDEAEVSEFLGKREVKAYVDQVFLDTGYRNRFKLGQALDSLIVVEFLASLYQIKYQIYLLVVA